MTNIESWHIVKFMSKLKSDIMVKRGGSTTRAYLYKARQASLLN